MPLTRTGAYFNDGVSISVGRLTGETGSLVAAGAGLQLSLLGVPGSATDYVAGELEIGGAGTGTLAVRNNAIVRVQNFELGDAPGGRGTATISAGGRLYSVAGLGEAPSFLGVEVAQIAGSVGTLTVTGEGSLLESSGGTGRIQVGSYGTGTLNIRNGAEAHGFDMDFGRNSGGRALVTVDGAGSRLLVSDAFGAFDDDPGQAGFLRLGRNAGSYGRLVVTNGGTVDVQNDPTDIFDLPSVIVGQNGGARGRLVVDGAGSSLNITMTGSSTDSIAPGNGFYYGPWLRLGSNGGSGDVVVRNGGAIRLDGEDSNIRIGERANTTGETVRSTLTIESGGQVSVRSVGTELRASVDVGRNSGAQGELVITGAGSRLRIESDNLDNVDLDGEGTTGARLTVGDNGTGSLRIERGGAVDIVGGDDGFTGLTLGYSGPGNLGAGQYNATATITGAGSRLTISALGGESTETSGQIRIARETGANAILSIQDGAVVDNSSTFAATRLAQETGTRAVLEIGDAGSVLRAGALLSVGNALDFSTIDATNPLPRITGTGGEGNLFIFDGALVTAGNTVVGADSSLVVNGGTLRSAVEIRGGDLSVNGTIDGTLDLRGNLDLIGSGEGSGFADLNVGAMDLSGNLTIRSGSRLDFDIGQMIDGQSDLIQVGGRVAGAVFVTSFSLNSAAKFGVGQRVTVLEAAATAPVVNVALSADGFDFVLKSVGKTWVIEALEARGGFSLAPSTAALNEITLTSNAGDVSVALGGLAGQTASGVSLIDGSERNDRILSATGLTRDMTIAAGAGNDVIVTGNGRQEIYGEAGNDRITSGTAADRIEGGAGNDAIVSGGGNDTVIGGAGNDTLTGGLGADTIEGGEGADRIEGGGAIDRLTGGAGVDTFVFRRGFATDTIVDFDAAAEKLDFSLHSGVDAFADLTIAQSGSSTVISDGLGGRIVLLATDRAQIGADDFLF